MRKLFHDLVQASAAEGPTARERSVKQAFQSNAQAVTYIVNSQNPEALLVEAGIKKYGLIDHSHLATGKVLQLISEFSQARAQFGFREFTPNAVNVISENLIGHRNAHALCERINQGIGRVKFSEQPTLQQLVNGEDGPKMRDPKLEELLKTHLPKYYDNLPIADKRRLGLSVLRLHPRADNFDHLEAVLQNTGPFVQKVFQLLKDNVDHPRLAKIFGKIQSQVQPFPFEQMKPIVERRFGPIERAFKTFDQNPIASGTIGQVHLATLHNGDQVVVKILRPRVKELLEVDLQTLRKVVPDQGTMEIIVKMYETVLAETNLMLEAEFLAKGEMYIDKKAGVSIARLHPQFRAQPDVLVAERAPGSPMTSFEGDSVKELELKGKALEKLAGIWFRKAIFETGFFHGDLHGGNLFFKADPDSKLGYMLTVIDFGNAHNLEVRQQQGFVKLSVASLINARYAASHAILEMLDLPKSDLPKVRKIISEAFKNADSVSERLTLTILGLESANYTLPKPFVSFARARQFIDEAIIKINSEIIKKGGKRQFGTLNVYAWETMTQMFRQLPWQQNVLSAYFLGGLATNTCVDAMDALSLRLPDRLWWKKSPNPN